MTIQGTEQGRAPRAKPGAVRGFLFDAVMAIVLMLGISVLFGIGWATVQGIQAGMAGMDPAEAQAAIGTPGATAMLWMVLLGTGGAALIVYLWRRRASPVERAASWAIARRPATWGWAAGTAVAVFVATNAVQWVMARAGMEIVPSNLQVIEDALATSPAFVLLFAAVVAPAYEELLFRRVLFGRLWAAGKPWLGLVLSSAVFALMHEIPGATGNPLEVTLLLWLVYGGMGAAFAWVYWRTGTLWAAFAAHGLHNLASVLFLLG